MKVSYYFTGAEGLAAFARGEAVVIWKEPLREEGDVPIMVREADVIWGDSIFGGPTYTLARGAKLTTLSANALSS